jgi:hypothetical protein
MQPLTPIEPSLLQDLTAHPERVWEQPCDIQLSVAQDPNTPRSLLEVLVDRAEPTIAEVARLHVNWAGELTTDWRSEIDAVFQGLQLGQNDRLAVELLKLGPVPPEFLSEWVPANHLTQALKNPHMPLRYRLKFLERLALEPTLEPRLQVAESPETPLAVLEQLIGDLELPVRLATKYNPACPEALVQLVEGQQAIACDWGTDAERLTNLGQSRWDWIRLAVAQNPSTSAQMLMQLANDRVLKIQLAVAKNPSTPSDVLASLVDRSDAGIQKEIAEHPNATEAMLRQLLPSQQSTILQRQNLPASVLQQLFDNAIAQDPIKGAEGIRHYLFKQPNTPEAVLVALSEVDLEAIRADILAKNPPIAKTMEEWVNDRIDYLAEVARHPNVTAQILERLAQSPSYRVRLVVALNPLTPNNLKRQLLEELSIHPDKRIKVQIARDSNTPEQILEAMAHGELYQPKLLKEIRRILASEYPENSSSYESVADQAMSFLKHNVLAPAGVSVNVDRWMEIIETQDLLAAMANSVQSQDLQSTRWIERITFRLEDLYLDFDESIRQRLASGLCQILDLVNSIIKNHPVERETGIALVGNSNTPASLREALTTQLRRPNQSLDTYENDCPLLVALANNSQISESERHQCIQLLMDADFGKLLLASDPKTPVEILEQLLENINLRMDPRDKLVRNPSTPEYLLRQIGEQPQEPYWYEIISHPNTPVALLLQYARQEPKNFSSAETRLDRILRHAKLPSLERYRLILKRDAALETKKANEVLAKRPDSPYALAQVIENGDRNAKITAA